MNKTKLRLAFDHFWSGFSYQSNYFQKMFATQYDVEIVNERCDVLIYSCFESMDKHRSERLWNSSKNKIFYTGENRISDLGRKGDIILSFEPTKGNNIRLPLWVLYVNWFDETSGEAENPAYLIPLKTIANKIRIKPRSKFGVFVGGNPVYPREQLKKYEDIEIFGNLGTQLGGNEETKINKLKEYTYGLALENSIGWGYVTEKLLHCAVAGNRCVYYGDLAYAQHDFDGLNIMPWEEFVGNMDGLRKEKHTDIITQSLFRNKASLDRWSPSEMLRKIGGA